MEPLLTMRGVDKAFAGVPALAGAELTVAPGEVHALIGQNGAGKSTLIKVLTGAHARDAGEVRLMGRPVRFASPAEAQRGGVSTIYQEVNLVPQRSVTENLVLGREPRRWGLIDWRRAERDAREALARLGLELDVASPLGSYDIAVQQLVAIARAVSLDARLVIMDEPTSSLDEGETEALFAVIRGLRADGVSVLYVSHHLSELFAVCDRVTVMRDGRTVACRPMAEVTRLELVSLMLGRDAGEIEAEGATGFEGAAEGGRQVVLEVEGLSDGGALRSASFVVHRGEIVGLAGLLGSGRSEAARAVFGLAPGAAGRREVRGRPVSYDGPRGAIADGLGLLTEDRKRDGIVPGLSVRENLTLAAVRRLARGWTIPRGEERALARRLAERLGVRMAGLEQPIRELSGGNQQKVLLARWLAVDPQLLMLDEPTRGVDVGAKREIQRIVGELARRGVGVLLISSEFEELVEGAHRVVVLQDGRTVATLEREALSEDALIHAVAAEPGAAA